MTLRVVIPPHPLIGHWLSILRHKTTPGPIYSTGLEQIGKWLTYEALREWIPYRTEKIDTNKSETEGIIIDSAIPILGLTKFKNGLQLWMGARELLPNATLCLDTIPHNIDDKSGVIIYVDQIIKGDEILPSLETLVKYRIGMDQIRVITALTSNEGLINIAKDFPQLTIYSTCIDPDIANENELIPGIGDPQYRINTRVA
ncbi:MULTISPECIES: uracil phosphoribosyltransferase [Prochlorococcus]|uniref:uracil phosphoribosyltransferase n=1 Tax=Prochlorococcus TaxID=1218 RepID=UPI001F4C6F79|nr:MULTISPECIES: uracil phosphoribosyltransferase [Prochlorococcus]